MSASNLTQKDYILFGIIAMLFFPQILTTWESRQYNSTQTLERRVGELENRFTRIESRFGGIEDDLKDIIEKLEAFKQPIFEANRLKIDVENFIEDSESENLRQWARINSNEEKINTVQTRLDDLFVRDANR